jgi:hypothetical protein
VAKARRELSAVGMRRDSSVSSLRFTIEAGQTTFAFRPPARTLVRTSSAQGVSVLRGLAGRELPDSRLSHRAVEREAHVVERIHARADACPAIFVADDESNTLLSMRRGWSLQQKLLNIADVLPILWDR